MKRRIYPRALDRDEIDDFDVDPMDSSGNKGQSDNSATDVYSAGSVRLIHKRITDTYLQLNFLLPDCFGHYVRIDCFDSSGLLDSIESSCFSLCRYYLFPKSPEASVVIEVFVDNVFAYGRRFRVPGHLRTVKKIDPEELKSRVNEVLKTVNETVEEESANYLDLDLTVDMSGLSAEALEFLRGE